MYSRVLKMGDTQTQQPAYNTLVMLVKEQCCIDLNRNGDQYF